jgi:hypothetical protein
MQEQGHPFNNFETNRTDQVYYLLVSFQESRTIPADNFTYSCIADLIFDSAEARLSNSGSCSSSVWAFESEFIRCSFDILVYSLPPTTALIHLYKHERSDMQLEILNGSMHAFYHAITLCVEYENL